MCILAVSVVSQAPLFRATCSGKNMQHQLKLQGAFFNLHDEKKHADLRSHGRHQKNTRMSMHLFSKLTKFIFPSSLPLAWMHTAPDLSKNLQQGHGLLFGRVFYYVICGFVPRATYVAHGSCCETKLLVFVWKKHVSMKENTSSQKVVWPQIQTDIGSAIAWPGTNASEVCQTQSTTVVLDFAVPIFDVKF